MLACIYPKLAASTQCRCWVASLLKMLVKQHSAYDRLSTAETYETNNKHTPPVYQEVVNKNNENNKCLD